MMMAVMVMFSMVQAVLAAAGPTSPSTDLRRQLYELNALKRAVTVQVDLCNQDNSWRSSGSAAFTNDEATLTMDVSTGPGYYRGSANWNDKWGNALFSSSEYKLVLFKAGMNLKDFPVYLNSGTTVHLKIEGPSNGDGVWVNGGQAWFLDGLWHVYVDQPWLVDSLNIVWAGHGGWTVNVDPSFQFDSVIQLATTNMNPGNDIVSQMMAMSYSGEDSWVDGVVASYNSTVGDSQGNPMAELVTSIPSGTKVMVFFSYWQEGLGTVEYYNTTVKVTDVLVNGTVIRVPLTGTWFNLNQTQVRIVWQDTDGKYWQTWASVPTSGGPVVVGEKGG